MFLTLIDGARVESENADPVITISDSGEWVEKSRSEATKAISVQADGSLTEEIIPQNLFSYPDFESGIDTFIKESSARFDRVTTAPFAGTYCGRQYAVSSTNSAMYKAFTVESGKNYIFRCYKKGGSSTSYVMLGTSAFGQQYFKIQGTYAAWTLLEQSFVTTSTVLYVSIGPGYPNRDGGYFDNISIVSS